MLIGCSLPAKTFMPEYTLGDTAQPALQTLLYGYEVAKRYGYDYIEASVGAVQDLTAEELDILCRQIRLGVFSLCACNSFVPPTLPLCTAAESDIEAFLYSTMQKLDRLHVCTVIFGSGAARRAPQDMPKETAREKILRFLHQCSRIGARYGITTAIEPLNHTETNMITTVQEGAGLAERIGRANIRLLPDLFHMAVEGEDPSVLPVLRDRIVHLHASEAPGRVWPGKYGGAFLRQCGEVFRKAGYRPNITVECVFGDFPEEAEKSIQFMKECFKCSQ